MLLTTSRIVFVGGKGGVGKTTLAAASAVATADEGVRTLLVSTDPAHSTSDVLETPLGPEPRRVSGELWAMEIDPEHEADRYIADVKARIADATPPRLMGEVERQIDLARVSPGAEEAAVFDRFTRILERDAEGYGCVVFDTAPTGQTLRLLSLPELMQAWIGGLISRREQVNVTGRMWRTVAGRAAGEAREAPDPVLAALEERRDRFRRARERLIDPRQTTFHFVLIPERLPILETEKAVRTLDKYGIPVGTIVVNRVLPDEGSGAAAGDAAAGGGFLDRRRERERRYLTRVAEAFAGHTMCRVPLFDSDVVGLAALRQVAEALAPGPGYITRP